MTKKSEIVATPEHNFLPVIQGMERTRALVVANLGSDTLSPFDLERAVNPSGKSTQWTIPGLEEEPETVNELQGIVVYHKSVRAYWAEEYKGGGHPPDCSSSDSITGEGDPGGPCAHCPFSKFGSGPNNSQACKQVKRVFLLREGELLPMLINVSPGNYQNAKTFFVRLMSKRQLAFNECLIKMKLKGAVSASGFDYAEVTFALIEPLAQDLKDQMAQFTEMLTPYLDSIKDEEDLGEFVEEPEF
jgi:hypothetical protein